MVRQHDDHFFPDDAPLMSTDSNEALPNGPMEQTYLCVINIMHLVEDDELHITNQICALVQHAAQNFGCHNKTVGFWVDLDISGENSDRGR